MRLKIAPALPVTQAAMLMACAGAALGQQAIFTNLGVLPGGAYSHAFSVSGDHLVVVGDCLIQPGGLRAFRWTAAAGMQSLGVLAGGDTSQALGVSGDGSIVVGLGNFSVPSVGNSAFRWTSGAGMVRLGTLPGGTSSLARGVSGDGSVVVGDSFTQSTNVTRAFRWTSAAGMADLGSLPGGSNAYGYAASGDGSVVVGSSTSSVGQRAFRWTAAGGMQELGVLPGGASSVAYSVSSDGAVVAGYSNTPAGNRAFRWTSTGGMVSLGVLPGGGISIADCVSGDGSVVVGVSQSALGVHAFLWTQAQGMVDLNTYLPTLGVNLTGWDLSEAHGVSGDGAVIVGWETLNGFTRAWTVNVDPDTDGDGLRDSWEIYGVPYTDINGVQQRVMLPGADPMHKDLYVEVDAMAGFGLSSLAVSLVQTAFANAPVSNPVGPPGVTLHVLRDDADLPHLAVWQTDGCWPLDFVNYRMNHYGTASERNDPSAPYLLAAKSKAYRYCIVADSAGPNSIGGCGQTPGDNFVIFAVGGRVTALEQASEFMHELGHNLGLGHGGGDDVNGKPNYPSIMNYVLAYKSAWNSSFWTLDYSRAGPPDLADLNEASLNEPVGVGASGGIYSGFRMPFGVNVIQGGNTVRAVRYVRLDGSQTDFGDTAGTGFQDGHFDAGVAQDLNYVVQAPAGIHLPSEPSPGQVLTAHDDWATVSLPLAAAIGSGAPAPSYPMDELTWAAQDWIEQNFPVPVSDCYANCDGSTTIPVLNVNDFICFQARFAAGDTYANCDGSTNVPVLNVNDFICFQGRFAAGCP